MMQRGPYRGPTIRAARRWCWWRFHWSLVVLVLVWWASTATGQPCPVRESVDITNGTEDTGGRIDYEGVLYGPSQHFWDGGVRRGCVCLVRQCIHICCPGVPCTVEELNVNVSMEPLDGASYRTVDLAQDPGRYHMLYSLPECDGTLLSLDWNEYVLRPDNTLAYGSSVYGYRQYCLQTEGPEGLVNAGYCETVDALAFHRMYSIGIIVSIPFLLATFLVYAILPEMRNVPGKSLMCYVGSLIVSYVLLALMRFNVYGYRSTLCFVTGYVVYFSLLASFFWLNVMSFDIFWTFGGSRGRTSERRRFLYYCLYAWGTPLVILSFVLLADNTDFLHEAIRPQIGTSRCFVKEEMLIGFLYMYLPLLVLVGANVLFFAITAIRIFRMEQATAAALSGDSRRHAKYEKDRNRFSLYLRLFTIMGVTWTVEIVTWLVGGESWLVYALDICNLFTGIVIFVLFVWKQKVKTLLLQRFTNREESRARAEHQTNTSTISTTRSTEVKFGPNPTNVPLTDMTHAN